MRQLLGRVTMGRFRPSLNSRLGAALRVVLVGQPLRPRVSPSVAPALAAGAGDNRGAPQLGAEQSISQEPHASPISQAE